MSELVPMDIERYEEMEAVTNLYLKAKHPTEIAKILGMKRKDVVLRIEEWKEFAKTDAATKDRVAEALNSMDEHYQMLIKKAHETIDEIDDYLNAGGENDKFDPTKYFAQRIKSLEFLRDIEQKRIDMFSKAGLLEAADMGDQVAEQEAQAEALIAILRDVSYKCPRCKGEVAFRISQITGQSEEIVTDIVQGETVE